MRVLLDTQSIVWSLEDRQKLSVRAQQTILAAQTVFISPVSFYELAIKIRIGKAIGSKRPLDDIIAESLASGFQWLSLDRSHLTAYDHIPLYEDHRDPFDRMILAIALAENLTLVSSDTNFPRYSDLVNVLW